MSADKRAQGSQFGPVPEHRGQHRLHRGRHRPPRRGGAAVQRGRHTALQRRVDSGINYPGVISGVHTQAMDGDGFNQWAVDDAGGRMRMRLLASYSAAEIGLGHLIQQSATSAQRGAWRARASRPPPRAGPASGRARAC
jgi:hypothetical protein